ncbi:MAG: bifunctional shikimate kinase/3-dehydroquinate synthase [Chloroflexota bacterium]
MSEAIVLVGLPGSGKSSVGRQLAAELGRPFIDLDVLIEERTGHHPAVLIASEGEPRFRELESEAIVAACAVSGAVIATGGGAVLDPLNRWALWNAGRSVWLDAPDEVLLARLRKDPVERPLLKGDALAALAATRARRMAYYRAADLHLDADAPVEASVAAIRAALATPHPGSRRLFDARVRRDHPMGPREAQVLLGRDLDAAALHAAIAERSTGAPLVVADERAAAALPDLMAALPDERRIVFRAGERNKRLRTAEALLETAATLGCERGDAWVAVGGGTTGDLVGTAAALYFRGAPLIQVPTTWLAMADASIGGKVAVDLAAAKNSAGAFWPPSAVIGDVASLRTLPRARLLDGMGESLKMGLIGDPAAWSLVETRGRAALADDEAARYALVERAARLKLEIVDRDPFEHGERRQLNLGHTLGHALEIESRYRLAHGQAVVLGLRAVALIAQERGAEPGLADRIDSVIAALGYARRRRFDPAVVKGALRGDKKRHKGRQRWILPMAVGRMAEVDDVTDDELERAMRHIHMEAA